VIAVVFELVIDATFRPRRPLPLSPPLPSHCYLTSDSRLTDGAGPNFSDLLVALLVAEGTRDGWWRGDEEVIAVVLVVVDGCLFFAVMAPISRAQVTL